MQTKTKKRLRNLAILAGVIAVVKVVIIGKEPEDPPPDGWWRLSPLRDYDEEGSYEDLIAPDKVEARA